MDWGMLERLFDEDSWRRKQVEKLPPATMNDMQGPTLEDRFRRLQQPMETALQRELRLRDMYRKIERDGKFWNWPQPMPKNLWDVWISDQIKSQKEPPLI